MMSTENCYEPTVDFDLKYLIRCEFDELKKNSDKCCFKFPIFYAEKYQSYIQELALQYNLKFQIKYTNGGHKCVQIFKENCPTYCTEEATFQLTNLSQKEIFKYLYENPVDIKERLELHPAFSKKTQLPKPRVQIYRFSMNQFKINLPLIPPASSQAVVNRYESRRCSLPIYYYRNMLLQTIEKNQITLVCGDAAIGKSTQLPQYILENATEKMQHCRIIFAHIEPLAAVNSSRIVSDERGDTLGFQIGYQIRLRSASSCTTTNLLYTTTDFFLRCLMGVNTKDVFTDITHIILGDMQEREFNTDLLLFEIKEILTFYPSLKIILLTNSRNYENFQQYFKNISIFHMARSYSNVQIKTLPKILEMLNYKEKIQIDSHGGNKASNSAALKHNRSNRQYFLDGIIQVYFETGSDKIFNELLYLIDVEEVSINVRNSKNKMTILMAAAKNNNIEHLKILLSKNADLFAMDVNNRTALDWSKFYQSSTGCSHLSKFLSQIQQQHIDKNKEILETYKNSRKLHIEIDFVLITELVQYIHENLPSGTILIFLSNYEDLARMEYHLKNKFNGNSTSNKNYQLKIFKFHNNVQHHDLNEIIQTESTNILRKCVLSTKLSESCINLNDVVYVIDSGRHRNSATQHDMNYCEAKQLQWITQEQSEFRKLIAGRYKPGHCFRLYTDSEYENFKCNIRPQLQELSLEKICLYVKLLSPYTTVADHFNRLICGPIMKTKIEQSVLLLKKIGAFDDQESITILGIRLVDIPLDVQLGKTLIYSIMFQCLDPVLTIVSILSYKDPLLFSKYATDEERDRNYVRRRNLITQDSPSDLLVLLRLFQLWQDERGKMKSDELTLDQYALDENLQQVCQLRVQIVGTVRAAQLIHSQGILGMHYINLKANNWALVKACFVAGMYPQICRIEKDKIKSSDNTIREIRLDPNSILSKPLPESHANYENLESKWLIHQGYLKYSDFKIISHCTPIHPVTLCLLAGNLKRGEEDLKPLLPIVTKKQEAEDFNVQIISQEKNDNVVMDCYLIDDWITFSLSPNDSKLLFNLRLKFSHFFLDILENCDNEERMRKFRFQYSQRLCILETISRILTYEDRSWNFTKPERVGDRPKALPFSLISEISSRIPDVEFYSPPEEEYVAEILSNFPDQIHVSNNNSVHMTPDSNVLTSSVHNFTNYNSWGTNNWRSSNFDGNTHQLLPAIKNNVFNTIAKEAQKNPYINHVNDAIRVNQYQQNIVSRNWRNNEKVSLMNTNGIENVSNLNVASCSSLQSTNAPWNFQKYYHQSPQYQNCQQHQQEQKQLKLNQKRQQQQLQNIEEIQKNFHLIKSSKFFILPCPNKTHAYKFSTENFWNDGTTLWDAICIQYVKDNDPFFIIFLYDLETSTFCGFGQMIKLSNAEFRLSEIARLDFTLEMLKSSLEGEVYDVNKVFSLLRYMEIDTDLGLLLYRIMNLYLKS